MPRYPSSINKQLLAKLCFSYVHAVGNTNHEQYNTVQQRWFEPTPQLWKNDSATDHRALRNAQKAKHEVQHCKSTQVHSKWH